MKLEDVPVVGEIARSGAKDRVFDALLLAGRPLVAIVAALGRSLLTIGLVTAYLVAFVGYTLYKAVTRYR